MNRGYNKPGGQVLHFSWFAAACTWCIREKPEIARDPVSMNRLYRGKDVPGFMRTYLDCIPCIMQQMLRTARLVTDDEKLQMQVLVESGRMLDTFQLEASPPQMVRGLYQRLSEIVGDPDPYYQLRKSSTEQALKLYPRLKAFASAAEPPILAGAAVAAAGSLADSGAVSGAGLLGGFSGIPG